MSSSSIRSEIGNLEKKLASLHKEQSQHSEKAMKAAHAANSKFQQAHKTKSDSTSRSYVRQAESEEKKHVAANKKVADLSKKIADVIKALVDRKKRLESALKQERQKEEREHKTRLRNEERENEKRRRKEKDHAREIAHISRPEVRHVFIAPPIPEVLRILYLTASPEQNNHLRVDAEVNSVLRALRGAPYRDQINLQVRPAASYQDLLDGINDIRPHVVHFSGHGNAGLLAFDNASIDSPKSVIVKFDVLASMIGATTQPPKLLVMNACSSLHGSDILLEAVPILIGMQDSVGDAAAGVFATQFYAAIASAQPIGFALRQAKATLKAALMKDDAELPQLAHRDDIDPDEVTLIIQ